MYYKYYNVHKLTILCKSLKTVIIKIYILHALLVLLVTMLVTTIITLYDPTL